MENNKTMVMEEKTLDMLNHHLKNYKIFGFKGASEMRLFSVERETNGEQEVYRLVREGKRDHSKVDNYWVDKERFSFSNKSVLSEIGRYLKAHYGISVQHSAFHTHFWITKITPDDHTVSVINGSWSTDLYPVGKEVEWFMNRSEARLYAVENVEKYFWYPVQELTIKNLNEYSSRYLKETSEDLVGRIIVDNAEEIAKSKASWQTTSVQEVIRSGGTKVFTDLKDMAMAEFSQQLSLMIVNRIRREQHMYTPGTIINALKSIVEEDRALVLTLLREATENGIAEKEERLSMTNHTFVVGDYVRVKDGYAPGRIVSIDADKNCNVRGRDKMDTENTFGLYNASELDIIFPKKAVDILWKDIHKGNHVSFKGTGYCYNYHALGTYSVDDDFNEDEILGDMPANISKEYGDIAKFTPHVSNSADQSVVK